MSRIKPPSDEIIEFIRQNYTCNEFGHVNGPLKDNVGSVENTPHGPICKIEVKGRAVRRYHIVWFLNKGYWPTKELDHRDRDTLNDRIENLREVTVHEQQGNKKNSRMYKGFSIVESKDKVRNKPWRVRNQKHGVNVGYFESETLAKKAVDEYLEKFGKWWV